MKGAHRAGKDSASCGHRDAGGCPTVFINGFPAMRAYDDRDRAGGQILGPGAKNVFVGNARLSLVGDTVLPHGRGNHASATIATGSPDVLATPNPPIERWMVDELASTNIGGVLSDAATIAKGILSVFPMMIEMAQKHPKLTTVMIMLCIMFPQAAAWLAVAGSAASFFKLGNAMLRVSDAKSEAERQAALHEVGQALGELGLSFGPQLKGFLFKYLKPEVLAKVGALFQNLIRSKGGSFQQMLKAVTELWNTPFFQGLRNVFSKERPEVLPPRRPTNVLPPQRQTKLPFANPADVPKLLARLGVRELPPETALSAQQKMNYDMALAVIVKLLPPGSNITSVRAVSRGVGNAMSVKVNPDRTFTLLLNADVKITELAQLTRDSPLSNYSAFTDQGVFRTEHLNDMNIILSIILHEVAHARFVASRSAVVFRASVAKTRAEFELAVSKASDAQRRDLESAWNLFSDAYSMLQKEFTAYSSMSPQEFYADYNAMSGLGLPISPKVTKLYNSLFGPGAPMGPTEGPPIPVR